LQGKALKHFNVGCLKALRASLRFVTDSLIFDECPETIAPDFRKVGEQVIAARIRRNKAETLALVKPLHRTGIHNKP
jgi:hypothetical protein